MTTDTEWTLFDDANVDSMGEWFNVVKYCMTARCQPTVLFFERLDPDELVTKTGG